MTWLPWKRGYLETSQSKHAATYPYVRTAEREQDFLYSEPLYTFSQRLYSRADELFEPDNLAALKGKRFCYPLGWQPPAEIQQMVDNGELSRHSPMTLAACAELLLRTRDDFFLANPVLGDQALLQVGEQAQHLRFSTNSFPTNTLHLIISHHYPQAKSLMSSFNQGLAMLYEGGDYEQLIKSYFQTLEANK